MIAAVIKGQSNGSAALWRPLLEEEGTATSGFSPASGAKVTAGATETRLLQEFIKNACANES